MSKEEAEKVLEAAASLESASKREPDEEKAHEMWEQSMSLYRIWRRYS